MAQAMTMIIYTQVAKHTTALEKLEVVQQIYLEINKTHRTHK